MGVCVKKLTCILASAALVLLTSCGQQGRRGFGFGAKNDYNNAPEASSQRECCNYIPMGEVSTMCRIVNKRSGSIQIAHCYWSVTSSGERKCKCTKARI